MAMRNWPPKATATPTAPSMSAVFAACARPLNRAATGAAPRDALQLAQLLERVDPDIRVGADADPDPTLAQLLHRREAVAEVGLGCQAQADSCAGIGDQIQLESVCVGGVHDGRSGPEAATVGQQLDRPQALFS